jgi:kumamolisin
MTARHYLLGAALSTALAAAGTLNATPYPHGERLPANDLGAATAIEGDTPLTVTITLMPRDSDKRDKLIESVYTPGSLRFHQFLTPDEFKASFGPSTATINSVTRHFQAQGLTVTRAACAQLHVTGTAAQIEKAFGVQLHSYEVPAGAFNPSYRYRAPLTAPHVPAAIAGSVRAVLGLDTRPRLTPHLQHPLQYALQRVNPTNSTNTKDPPGSWTVLDYAQYYDVNPLYRQGLNGRGQTVGILTFASFTPSDAYAYWKALGIRTDTGRITELPVDGGAGAPSDEAGSDETTLDVEQSGGLAPAAKILVYEAPNSNQGFVDAFAAAIDSNQADTVSISWGEWEGFDGPSPVIGNAAVTDPTSGEQTTILQALDDLLAQAALQGQSFFASAGDYGAFDSASSAPLEPSQGQPDSFSPVLSVDDPAAQRYITAAGGTTLPGPQVYNGPSGPITINIAQEQAWSWQYMEPVCSALGENPAQCGIYPAGSGGGVSIYVPRPAYQRTVAGVADSAPGQTFYELTPPPAQPLYALPSGFAGRNVPDISTNADPQTGYLLYYTSSAAGFGIFPAGGTSFVDPQLNGVVSLFVQGLRHRIGLLNPALYQIAGGRAAYHRQGPFREVAAGNNWYWRAQKGYNQASGVGVPDFANLYSAFLDMD